MTQGKIIEFHTKNEKQLFASSLWIDNVTEEIIYGGAKYGGKTYLGCSMIFGDALIYPQTNYFIARKELNDLRKFTIPSIHEVFFHWGLKFDDYASFNGQDNCFHLKNGSLVFLVACKEEPSDPMFERFGSMQMTRGWIEEGGEIAEAAKRHLSLSVGRWNNEKYNLKKKLLVTCNPKKGWLKWDYVDLWLKGELPITKRFVQAFATDNVHGDKDYIRSLSQEKDKVTRQRLWEGRWDYDEDERALFRMDALNDLFSNTVSKSNEKYLTIDVAGEGSDKTIFTFWNGLEVYRIDIYEKLRTDGIINQIRESAAQERIPYSHIAVDGIGEGSGVASSPLLDGIVSFKSSYQPFKTELSIVRLPNIGYTKEAPRFTEYKNLRSQCVFTFAGLVNEHEIAIKTEDQRIKSHIIEELSNYQDASAGDGKRMATQKEDIKAAIGRSPDLSDSFFQRMYFVLKEKLSPYQSEERARANEMLEMQIARTTQRQPMNSAE